MSPEEEVEALRKLLRKVQGSVGMWAALSYPKGIRGGRSRWTGQEQDLLRRAGIV